MMQKFWARVIAGLVALFIVPAAPAMAQATRTWVSGVGNDANPCSRTAPCKTFAGAISKTAVGGEINALDPGGFGAVTITKPITISATGVEGGVLVSGTNAIIINAGTTDKIVLAGLDIEGLNNGTSTNGINIIQARDVLVRDCIIRGFNAAGSGNGILVNGANQIGLTVQRSTIFNNNIGINVQSSGGNGAARVYDSLIAVHQSSGIRVSGAGNKAEISGNQIIRTTKSLDITSGGAVSSYGDNVLSAGDAPTIVPKG